jgi:hypothetical protein
MTLPAAPLIEVSIAGVPAAELERPAMLTLLASVHRCVCEPHAAKKQSHASVASTG